LGRIAKWYTGSADAWKEIAGYNDSMDVRALRTGDRILIPISLVKTTEPLAKVVEKPKSKPARRSSRDEAKQPAAAQEDSAGPSDDGQSAPAEVVQEGAATTETADTLAKPAEPPSQEPSAVSQPGAEPVSTGSDQPTLVEPAKLGVQAEPAHEKSVEDMLREEQAQLERLKQELGNTATQPQTN
jgi:hypothetical protein